GRERPVPRAPQDRDSIAPPVGGGEVEDAVPVEVARRDGLRSGAKITEINGLEGWGGRTDSRRQGVGAGRAAEPFNLEVIGRSTLEPLEVLYDEVIGVSERLAVTLDQRASQGIEERESR